MAALTPDATAPLMNPSFAQIRYPLCVMVGVLALFAVISCPLLAQSTPVPELAAAQQAVHRADQADADQYAPDLLNAARTALAQAQAAASSRSERKRAPDLAMRAAADADLARARSNEAVAKARVEQQRAEIAQLQRTLGTEGEQ